MKYARSRTRAGHHGALYYTQRTYLPTSLAAQRQLSHPMATTTDSSTRRRSRSRNYVYSNTTDNLQRNDRANLEYHGTGEPPYASSNVRGHISAIELHVNVAGANSESAAEANYGRAGDLDYLSPPKQRRRRHLCSILVRAPLSFDPRTCDSNISPQRRRLRGANGRHNHVAHALSASNSPDPLAPNDSHITQRAGGPIIPSRSIPLNEEPQTATSLPTSTETSKPSQPIPLNASSYATANPSTLSKNTAKPSRQKVNDHTPDEPSREEIAGSEPPQAEKVPHRGSNPSSSQSQSVDPPSLAQPHAIQDDHLPSPPKVPPTSGRSSTPPALEASNTYSSGTSEIALGKRPVSRGIPAPSEEQVLPNEAVPSMTKGGHDPLNEQPAPVSVSSPVRHPALKSKRKRTFIPAKYCSNHLLRPVVRWSHNSITIYTIKRGTPDGDPSRFWGNIEAITVYINKRATPRDD